MCIYILGRPDWRKNRQAFSAMGCPRLPYTGASGIGVRSVLLDEQVGGERFQPAVGLELLAAIERCCAVGQHFDDELRVSLDEFGAGFAIARVATDEHVGAERSIG